MAEHTPRPDQPRLRPAPLLFEPAQAASDPEHFFDLESIEDPRALLERATELTLAFRAAADRATEFQAVAAAQLADPRRFDLVVAEARDGAVPRVLVEGVLRDANGPSWTPDGRHLVVVRDDDAALDPVVVVPVDGGPPRALELGTVGHGDLDLVERDGALWLAWVAQGRVDDPVRDFKRLFVAPVSLP